MDYEFWCSLSDDEFAKHDVARVNLIAAIGLPGSESLEIEAAIRQIDRWTELVRLNTRHWSRSFVPGRQCRTGSEFRMMCLVTVLQRDLGVRYNKDCMEGPFNALDSRSQFIHGTLSEYGGTCCSLPVLYLAIGRRLGYPLYLVHTKHHLFVRWDDGGDDRFNFECASIGFVSDDDEHYRNWPEAFTEADRASSFLLRNLTPREELAVFIGSRGHCLLDNLQISEAMKAFYFATQIVPEHEPLWAIATMMEKIVDNMHNRRDSIYYPVTTRIDLASRIDVPSWQKGPLESARKDLHRIAGLHPHPVDPLALTAAMP